jgi:arginine/lysine/ornithine decarboxylase
MSLINLLRKKVRTVFFTTPSHGQKFFIVNKFRQFYKYDISETDAHNPQAALAAAQERAAKIYGTKYTYFLTNGSTSGIIAATLACTKPGDKVLIREDAHPSHLNAVKLAGCKPVYDKTENIKAMIVTRPTYEGLVSDIVKTPGVYLIVDEAHGALYPFSDRLPQSAVQIADFAVQSLHKTAGGLNPTALLHSNGIDPGEALAMINTTSPSYPLLASIEANINFLNSKRGRAKIEELIDNCLQLGIESLNQDPTKILIPSHIPTPGIEDEKDNGEYKLFLCGIGTSAKKIERLKRVLKKTNL